MKQSRFSKVLSLLLAVLMVLSLTTPATVSAAQPADHTANAVQVELHVKESKTLKVSGWYRNTVWTSSDPSVVTVDAGGTVTAEAEGTAAITAVSTPWFSFAGGTKTTAFVVTVTDSAELTVKVNEELALSVNPNGGTVTWSSSDDQIAVVSAEGVVKGLQPGDVIVTAEIVKVKYLFFGWIKTEIRCTERFEITVLPADPETPDFYTVTFETSGGSAVASQRVEAGQMAAEPETPTREGYAFAGWCTDPAFTNCYDFRTPVMADVTLYARWEAVPAEYSVVFESNGGTVVFTQFVKEGQTVQKPENPIKSGYVFAGWYADAALTTAYDFASPVTENLTLYAKWDEILPETYTVTFESNGGSAVERQVVQPGAAVTKPADPEKADFVFAGWYTDAALTAAYDFQAPVTGDLTLYAKWKSPAEAYYESSAEVLAIIQADQSPDVLSEAEAQALLESRGLGAYGVFYEYSMTGHRMVEAAAAVGSASQHPMYQTIYVSKNEEVWIIYVINGSVFAYPLSFGFVSDLRADLIFSESDQLTSYDDASNQFYVTVPHASEMIVQTVDTINAETLEQMTIREICRLSGAAVPAAPQEIFDSTVVPAVPAISSGDAEVTAYSSSDPFIVVSMGDSYSSGEGIEEFYGQELPLREKVHNEDWLAHRSIGSWPGQIRVPGTDNSCLSAYRVPYGERGSNNIQWYFTAVSGAETKNWNYDANDDNTHNGKQKKEYNKKEPGLFGARYKGTAWLPNQMDVFNYIDDLHDVDYVTLTVGGNDVDFAGVITCCIEPTYLEFGNNFLLERKLNKLWENIDSTIADIKSVYQRIHEKVPDAAILVAGYPKLLDKNGKGGIFSKNEATLVNEKVSAFNGKIRDMVKGAETELNTYFVDVEEEFDQDGGHQAYSQYEWINQIKWRKQSEDLTDGFMGLGFPSAYSMHPNKAGAWAYAECVNAKIKELEHQKAPHSISGQITIADTDMDMTNNTPLGGALVSLKLADGRSLVTMTPPTGAYTIDHIPEGTYQLTVTKEGFIPVTETIRITQNDADVIFNIAVEVIPETHSGTGYASGTIYDAGTGRPVSGLTLYIRRGLENTTGSVVQTIDMGSSTAYSTADGLEAGHYTVQIVDERTGISEKERYVTAHFNIKVLGGMTIGDQNGYVSNGLASEELRVVLSWGSAPSDLDAHMAGPDGSGGTFHEYFAMRDDGSDTDLDVDDTSSYGPETITIYQEHSGIYVYAIHDFSNRDETNSTAIANSGAQVKVYRGNQLLMTYNAPAGQGGTLWTVFSYDSTNQSFTTINKMSYESSVENVLQ